jgi:hypothetical protein
MSRVIPRLCIGLLAAGAFGWGARVAAAGPDHPAYLHALADLRNARANLQHGEGDPQVHWDERHAVETIEAAVREINEAAIRDGKNLEDHPPVDVREPRAGRLHRAQAALRAAREDVSKEEDNAFANGLRVRAIHHIDEALAFTEQGIAEAEHPPDPSPPPGGRCIESHRWRMIGNGCDSVWTFTPQGEGRFGFSEAGCANVQGTATRQGDVLTAEGTGSAGWHGRYVWRLPPNACAKASGSVTVLQGRGAGAEVGATLEPIASPTGADSAVGTWVWFNASRVNISPDGALYVNGQAAPAGTWVAVDAVSRQYQLSWKSGAVDRLTLSADGSGLAGSNQVGTHVTAGRTQ